MAYTPNERASVDTVDQIRDYIRDEFRAIAREFSESIAVDLRTVSVEPKKPREGMMVHADGVGWNPGFGKGPYIYQDGLWLPFLKSKGTTTNDDALPGEVGERRECICHSASNTVTISNAAPGVVSEAGHLRSIASAVFFTTTGGLPAPLVVNTTYYVSAQGYGPNSYSLSTTVDNALAGTSITTSSAGSGVHTATGGAKATTGVVQDIGGFILTPGDWDVWVDCFFQPDGTTVTTVGVFSSSDATAALVDGRKIGRIGILSIPAAGFIGAGSGGNISTGCGPGRVSTAINKTVYFNHLSVFTTAAMRVYGGIFAERVR